MEIAAEHVRPREDLASTQEDVDIRLLLHAFHAADDGYGTVDVLLEDTDVFVLCLDYKSFVAASVYFKCGTDSRARYIEDITCPRDDMNFIFDLTSERSERVRYRV